MTLFVFVTNESLHVLMHKICSCKWDGLCAFLIRFCFFNHIKTSKWSVVVPIDPIISNTYIHHPYLLYLYPFCFLFHESKRVILILVILICFLVCCCISKVIVQLLNQVYRLVIEKKLKPCVLIVLWIKKKIEMFALLTWV